MENIVLIIYLGIMIVMVIAAFILGRRSSKLHTNHDTTNETDFVDSGSDDTHHDHHQEHADHSTSSSSTCERQVKMNKFR